MLIQGEIKLVTRYKRAPEKVLMVNDKWLMINYKLRITTRAKRRTGEAMNNYENIKIRNP